MYIIQLKIWVWLEGEVAMKMNFLHKNPSSLLPM